MISLINFIIVSILLVIITTTVTTTPFLTATEVFPTNACESKYMYLSHQSSPSSVWTVGEINAILKAHNDERRIVSPMASKHQNGFVWGNKGYPMIVWDQKLADHANNYIKNCPGLVHSSNSYRSNVVGDNVTYSSVGENLYVGSGSRPVSSVGVSATNAWNAEKIDNTWSIGCNPFAGGSTCSGAGHYTAIISARVYAVGCAVAFCSTGWGTQLVCQMGLAGNMNMASSNEYNSTSVVSEAAECQIIPDHLTTTAGAPTPAPTTPTPAPTTTTTTTTPAPPPPSTSASSTTTVTSTTTSTTVTTTSTTTLPPPPAVAPENRYNRMFPHYRQLIFVDSSSPSFWFSNLSSAVLNTPSAQREGNNEYYIVLSSSATTSSSSLRTMIQDFDIAINTFNGGTENYTISAKFFLTLDTHSRSKSISAIQSEVDSLLNFFGTDIIDGFFVDHNNGTVNMSSTSSSVKAQVVFYDTGISNYIRTTKMKHLFVHPRNNNQGCTGMNSDVYNLVHCLEVSDLVVAFDGTKSDFLSNGSPWSLKSTTRQQLFGLNTVDTSKFAVIVHGVEDAITARSILVNSYTLFDISLGCVFDTMSSRNYPAPYFHSFDRLSSVPFSLRQNHNRRGTYVQLYGWKVGQLDWNTNATWFNEYHYILINDTKVDMLLQELQDKRFNSISLYNLPSIFGANLDQQLRNFMYKARKYYGIETIEAIGADFEPHWDQIYNFQTTNVAQSWDSASQSYNENRTLLCFDGVITEIEWWHGGGDVSVATNVIQYFKNKNPPRRFQHQPLQYKTYIGWISESDVKALVGSGIVSSIWPHGYVKTPNLVQGYIQSRVNWILAATVNSTVVTNPRHLAAVSIQPIFSTEGQELAAGNEHFMGDWFYHNSPGAVPKAENIVTDAINATWSDAQGVINGYQWYESFFTSSYGKSFRDQEKFQESTTTSTTMMMTSTSTMMMESQPSSSGAPTTSSSMAPMQSSTSTSNGQQTTTAMTSAGVQESTSTATQMMTPTPSTSTSTTTTVAAASSSPETVIPTVTQSASISQQPAYINITLNFPLLAKHHSENAILNAMRRDAVKTLSRILPVAAVLVNSFVDASVNPDAVTITFTLLPTDSFHSTTTNTTAMQLFTDGVNMMSKSPDAEVWLVETSALLLSTTGSSNIGTTRLMSAAVDNTFAAPTTPAPGGLNPSPESGGGCQAGCIVPIVLVLVLLIVAGIYVYYKKYGPGKRSGDGFLSGESVSLDEYFSAQQDFNAKMMMEQNSGTQQSNVNPLLIGSQPYYPVQSQQEDAFFGKGSQGHGDGEYHGRNPMMARRPGGANRMGGGNSTNTMSSPMGIQL